MRRLLMILMLGGGIQVAWGQAPTIAAGTVVDATTQQPVAFATVSTCEGRNGVLTDSRGHFELPTSPACTQTQVLEIRSVGYVAQRVNLPAPSPLLIRLVPQDIKLQPVDIIASKLTPRELVQRAIRRLPNHLASTTQICTLAYVRDQMQFSGMFTSMPIVQQHAVFSYVDSVNASTNPPLQWYLRGMWRSSGFGTVEQLAAGRTSGFACTDSSQRFSTRGGSIITTRQFGEPGYTYLLMLMTVMDDPIRNAASTSTPTPRTFRPALDAAWADQGTWTLKGMDSLPHAPTQLFRLERRSITLPTYPTYRVSHRLWIEPGTFRIFRYEQTIHPREDTAQIIERWVVDYALHSKRLRLKHLSRTLEWRAYCDQQEAGRFIRRLQVAALGWDRRLPPLPPVAPQARQSTPVAEFAWLPARLGEEFWPAP